MSIKALLQWTAFLAIAAVSLQAQSPAAIINVTVLGNLGPVLEGSDPLGASGHNGILSLQISESETPETVSGSSVVYSVPAGSVTTLIGSTRFTTITPSRLTITLGPAADTLSVLYSGQNGTQTRFEATLAPGSFSTAVLTHPEPFSPTPQNLTAAMGAAGPGSKLSYAYSGTLTVLGLDGSISNSIK